MEPKEDCRTIRERLSPYLEGELPPGEAVLVAGHLEECAACREELRLLSLTVRALRDLPQVPVPPGIMSGVRTAAAPSEGWAARWRAWTGTSWTRALAQAAALVIVAAGIVLLQQRYPGLRQEAVKVTAPRIVPVVPQPSPGPPGPEVSPEAPLPAPPAQPAPLSSPRATAPPAPPEKSIVESRPSPDKAARQTAVPEASPSPTARGKGPPAAGGQIQAKAPPAPVPYVKQYSAPLPPSTPAVEGAPAPQRPAVREAPSAQPPPPRPAPLMVPAPAPPERIAAEPGPARESAGRQLAAPEALPFPPVPATDLGGSARRQITSGEAQMEVSAVKHPPPPPQVEDRAVESVTAGLPREAAREAARPGERTAGRKTPSPAAGLPDMMQGLPAGSPSALREAPPYPPGRAAERAGRGEERQRGAPPAGAESERALSAAREKEERREQDFDLVIFATAPPGFDFEGFLGRNAGRLGGHVVSSRPLDGRARRRFGELTSSEGRMGGGTLEISLPAGRVDDLLDAVRGRSPIEILARERPSQGPGRPMSSIIVHVSQR